MRAKVLILTNHSYMFWRFRRELVQTLLDSCGCEVVLSTPFVGHEKDLAAMGIRCIQTDVDRRGMNPFRDRKLLNTYQRLLQEEQPDLVIAYSIKPNIYGGMVCKRSGTPYYANVQGMGTAFERPFLAFAVSVLYRNAFRKVRKVFFENASDAEEFCRRRIIRKEKEVVLHGAGINLQEYNCTPYPDNKKVHFLYLGRIMREKGMDELFMAAERLYRENNGFVLDLVGFYEDDYQKTIQRLEKENIAHFYGFQENPEPFYESAHCVVLPSWHEGMSNVLLEGAATGRALITTDIPGCREAVTEGENGFLTRVKNTESLYQAMKAFLMLEPEERAAMGVRGRKKMEREFNRDTVVSTVIQALKI